MSNYNIGLSGLTSNSQAIDTISNNIANSSTVGYKMGDFVFQDQFYKAINPLDPARAGMGTAKQNIRRIFTQGAIQSSANSLDMAITGAMGMFRLASNIAPDEVYYTRNGQFAVSKEVDASNPKRSYIVNENGMYLTGYSSLDGKTLSDSWTNRLTMPPVSLEPKSTETSTVSVTLDSRQSAFRTIDGKPFDPTDPTTYNNRVSQTVYSKDDGGNPHALALFYRRIEDKDLTVTYQDGVFSYSPTSVADPAGSDTNIVFPSQVTSSLTLLTPPSLEATVVSYDATGPEVAVADASAIAVGARVLLNGVDTGKVVVDPTDSSAVVLSGDIAATSGAQISFFNPSATSLIPQQTEVVLGAGPYALNDVLTLDVQGVAIPFTITSLLEADIYANMASVINARTDAALSGIRAVASATNVVLTHAGGAAFTATSADLTVTTTAPTLSASALNSSNVLPGQFLWAGGVAATPAPTPLGRVISIAGGVITYDDTTTATVGDTNTIDLAATTEPVFTFNPFVYSIKTQDGSVNTMSGDLWTNQTASFTAVTSQYEVYGSLDGNYFNELGSDDLYKSDTPISAGVTGAYNPLALMQFWGGKNVDAMVYDSVTGAPTFETKVILSGKVKTSGDIASSSDPDLIFSLDLTRTNNFSSSFNVAESAQDGYGESLLSTVAVDNEGRIVGTYGDGREFVSGQLVLVNFAATNGLAPVGNNVFAATYLSGDEVSKNVVIGKPGDQGLGAIRAGAVEASNVDLANELVKLLIQQRMYSANSQAIRAFDDTLTTTIRMTGG